MARILLSMRSLRFVQQYVTSQRGGFSPFMYGMLVGVSVLSTVAAYQAKVDIKEQTERKLEQQQREADDLALALENSIPVSYTHLTLPTKRRV